MPTSNPPRPTINKTRDSCACTDDRFRNRSTDTINVRGNGASRLDEIQSESGGLDPKCLAHQPQGIESAVPELLLCHGRTPSRSAAQYRLNSGTVIGVPTISAYGRQSFFWTTGAMNGSTKLQSSQLRVTGGKKIGFGVSVNCPSGIRHGGGASGAGGGDLRSNQPTITLDELA